MQVVRVHQLRRSFIEKVWRTALSFKKNVDSICILIVTLVTLFPVLTQFSWLSQDVSRKKVPVESACVPGWEGLSVPPFDVMYDFIMGMRHLTFLHFIPSYNRHNRDQVHSLCDKVNEFALLCRPYFGFETCFDFDFPSFYLALYTTANHTVSIQRVSSVTALEENKHLFRKQVDKLKAFSNFISIYIIIHW